MKILVLQVVHEHQFRLKLHLSMLWRRRAHITSQPSGQLTPLVLVIVVVRHRIRRRKPSERQLAHLQGHLHRSRHRRCRFEQGLEPRPFEEWQLE